jgi:hypothetical protein
MHHIASIGKLFGDGGLQEILSTSGVFATSSAVQMLQRKHYARAIRGLKIAYEAMMDLYLSAAETYAKDKALPWVDDETIALINVLDASFQERDSAVVRAKRSDIAKRLSDASDTLTKFKAAGRKLSCTFA